MNINFFSGIGSWELGLEIAQSCFNIRSPHLFVDKSIEINPISIDIYNSNFSTNVLPEDIKESNIIDKINFAYISFPCTGTSIRGRRQGLLNPDSALWHNAVKICYNNNASTIFIEQPSGFINNGAIEVVANLEEHGYKTTCLCLTARMFGLPHKRERLFIISSNTHDPHVKYWGESSWNDSFRANVKAIVSLAGRPEIITNECSHNHGISHTRVYKQFDPVTDIFGVKRRSQPHRAELINKYSLAIVPYCVASILSPYL